MLIVSGKEEYSNVVIMLYKPIQEIVLASALDQAFSLLYGHRNSVSCYSIYQTQMARKEKG